MPALGLLFRGLPCGIGHNRGCLFIGPLDYEPNEETGRSVEVITLDGDDMLALACLI